MTRLTRIVLLLAIAFFIAATTAATVPATAASPGDRERPASVTATIGNVTVRIDGPKLWTLSRIEYKGTILGVEDSAYGTVINIKDVGFIGTAHKEVEPEDVTELDFFLNSRAHPFSNTDVRGESFRVERRSRIRSFHLDSVLEVRDNRIYQSVRLRTASAVDLKVMYPFMYAWTPTATEYLYGTGRTTRVSGRFLGGSAENRQFDQGGMDWLAAYDGPSNKGAVSRVLARPKVGNTGMRIVDAPDVYRKFYVMCFDRETVPAGFDETYRIVTGFFEADATTWIAAANKMAAELAVN